MRLTCLASAALLALASATAGAQPPDPDRSEQRERDRAARIERIQQRERFDLFNDCEPMRLIILNSSGNLITVPGSRINAVQNAAESRLRAARLFTDALDSDLPSLFVAVVPDFRSDLVSRYVVRISYSKPLRDPATGLTHVTSTWQKERTAPDDDPAILNSLSQLLDQFLAAYLRVNAEACE